MKQVCLLCKRTSADNNLFCQETYCPAEMSPVILDYGEWLGDIEIVRAITVLRTSVLYEATHEGRRVLMKVAHPGAENKERLKREAEFLQTLQLKGQRPDTLPLLLPPYTGTTVAHDPYGKTMLHGHLLYFYLCEHFQGEPLSDALAKNPQLWINHVGWLTVSLATTVNQLHQRGFYHYGLHPGSLLVRFDENPSVPHIFLFDLGIAARKPELAGAWYPFAVPPAYTAPELIDPPTHRGPSALPGEAGDFHFAGGLRLQGAAGSGHTKEIDADYRTDVYGLGLLLYEMLVGEPAFAYEQMSDAEVYRAVERGQRAPMNRVEDVDRVAQVALRATKRREVSERQPYAVDMAKELVGLFGTAPEPKKRSLPGQETILVFVIASLAIAFLVVLAMVLSGTGA